MVPPSASQAICLASIGRSPLFSRPQQLMLRYSRRAPVLYVDPIQPPRRRVLLGYQGDPMRKAAEGLRSLSIVKPLPLDRTFAWTKRVNDCMVRGRGLVERYPDLGGIDGVLERVRLIRRFSREALWTTAVDEPLPRRWDGGPS